MDRTRNRYRYRYWLTPPDDEGFEDKVAEVYEVYKHAPERHQAGERTVSTDELTDVQVLERRHPGLRMAPGQVERRKLAFRAR